MKMAIASRCLRGLICAVLITLAPLFSGAALWADASSAPTNSAPSATDAASSPSTNAAPVKHGITITADLDDDDDVPANSSGHARHSSDGWELEGLLIPLAGIVGVFGMPALVVFLALYFNYRRRQETLATVREYLNKGLPVPPQLLEGSGGRDFKFSGSVRGACSDLSKGIRLTFVGVGVTLALLVHDPHSTTWGWGLIPLVMGLGYLISGLVQRSDPSTSEEPPTSPPPGKTPPS
jgi:hypothetical protein